MVTDTICNHDLGKNRNFTKTFVLVFNTIVCNTIKLQVIMFRIKHLLKLIARKKYN